MQAEKVYTKERDSIYEVQAERDKQYLSSASRRDRQCLRSASRKRDIIFAEQVEEVDIFYAVKKDSDVLIKDTLY